MGQSQAPKPYLTEKHLIDLQSSGLSPEQIAIAGHFSVDQVKAQELVGYKLPGLIFQYYGLDGKPYLKSDGQPFCRLKPDWGEFKAKDSAKYLSSQKAGCRPYFSRLWPDWETVAKSTKIDIWETEGEKKGDCACAHGLAAIAFGGVNSWVDKRDRQTGNELKESRPLPELQEINWQHRKVYQCFDSDIIDNSKVQSALAQRANKLSELGAIPYLVLLPNEIDGSKNGLDDFVARHGIDALKDLAKASMPTPLERKKDSENKVTVTLKLKEANEHYKALMARAVLKETWAYRAGIGWYEWQQTHWCLKKKEEFEQVLTQFMDAQGWQQRSSVIISSIIRQLQSRLLVREESWSPWGKLAFRNGTLDLKSGEFIPTHRPVDRLTKLRPYDFSLSAECPIWLHFISEAMEGDQERIELIRAMFRYIVLPRSKAQKAEIEKSFDFFGRKGTGKGTTLDVLTHLVGSDNVGSASVDTFKSATGLGQLLDKDVAIDFDAFGFLGNVGLYNKVVSNEPVEVKKLYQDICVVRLGVVVVRAYNAYVPVPDGAEGLDRRLTIIPFNQPPSNIDTELSRKLEAELSGIFAWCYSMAADEMRQRILSAGRIKAVAEASIDRFEANNPEFRFLSEVFPDGTTKIKAGALYDRYREWCQRNRLDAKSIVKFSAAIQVLGCERSKTKLNGCYYYTIPRMADFDIPTHLGIVQRQSNAIYQDGSKPDGEKARDSCRQLESQSSIQVKPSEVAGIEVEDQLIEKGIPPQESTNIPSTDGVRLSSVLNAFSTVSSAPNQSAEAFCEGDRIEVLKDGRWEEGILTSVPHEHTDPAKTIRCWQVSLNSGSKTYIWNPNNIRRANHSLGLQFACNKVEG